MESGLFKGSEGILLVDDEEIILEVGQAMLKTLGYRVIVAKGGRQAIEAMESMDNPIDLVVLDLIMPGMDGGQTFDRLHEIHPGIPVILSSGYSINEQANAILRRGCKGFIQKPFSISDFSKIIRKVLDEAKGSPCGRG
jgi:DNA-binding NtrC family response regulator